MIERSARRESAAHLVEPLEKDVLERGSEDVGLRWIDQIQRGTRQSGGGGEVGHRDALESVLREDVSSRGNDARGLVVGRERGTATFRDGFGVVEHGCV